MNLRPTYRASMYVMLTLATLVLSINATDYNRFAMLFPLGVAISGVFAYFGVDRNRRFGLDRNLGQFLALGSFLVAMAEYWADPSALLVALGHWLVYLQLVKMFLPKTVEDDWFLFLLGLVQVVIGGYIGQSVEIGLGILGWALVSMWTLGLFYLDREARANIVEPGVSVSPEPNHASPYPGLFNLDFFLSAFLVALTTLALGTLIFLAMPRFGSLASAKTTPGGQSHLTGFSEEVRLGQMGEILENNGVVMTIELYDHEKNTLHPSEELHWRGVTLSHYEKGRWSRTKTHASNSALDKMEPRPANSSSEIIEQRIRIEPTDSDVLFALRPIFSAYPVDGGSQHIAFNIPDGTLFRSDISGSPFSESVNRRARSLDYVVVSSNNEDAIQPSERPFPDLQDRELLLQVPAEIRPDLQRIARQVLGPDAPPSALSRARALENYFLASGEFTYTLEMGRVDPSLDPIVDFLVNRKRGHCEYFASALTLLLRSQRIPARMVNGFKGGDWNGLVRVVTVRQKHAHSWVEALIGQDDMGRPVWVTLDPTPALERDAVVAQVSNLPEFLRIISDALRHGWANFVVGFNQERQQRLLYGPIKQLATEAAQGFRIMYLGLRTALGWLFVFEQVGDFFSFRGFVVSVCTMLLAVALFRGLVWLYRRFLAHNRSADLDGGPESSSVAFYHRLLRLLEAAGLSRPESETPREFARRAVVHLSAVSEGLDGFAEIPTRVVEAFYLVRFGHHTLDPLTIRDLDQRLDSLETRLRPPRS